MRHLLPRYMTLAVYAFVLMVGTLIVTAPYSVGAAEEVKVAPTPYTLLAPIPLNGPNGGNTTEITSATYLPGLFKLIIGVASILAVFMIIYGGFKYMSTEAFTGKGDAKEIIQRAIWGLLLTAGAWLIVNTINPKLTQLNLSIPNLGLKAAPPASNGEGGGGVTGKTGCKDSACVYSYKNSAGDTIRYKECNNCSGVRSFGLTPNLDTVDGKTVQINTDLGNKLKVVSTVSGNPSFRVSESWPPTVNHASQEQYDGTSVDVSLNSKTPQNVNAFMLNATTQGLRVEYEVKTLDDARPYVQYGIPLCDTGRKTACVLPVSYVTGEHFSVYKN